MGSSRSLAVKLVCLALAAVGLAACGSASSNNGHSGANAAANGGGSSSGGGSGSGNALSGKKVGIVYLGLDDPFYQAFQRGARAWAKAHNVTLEEVDGQKNPQTMTSGIENMITQQVSGIIFSPVDAAAAVTPIKEAQNAHIPILVNSIRAAGGVQYPFVGQNEGVEEKVLGAAAAKLFHKKFGKSTPAKLMTEECAAATVVSTERANGFLQGWKSVDPHLQILGRLDGKCTQQGAVTAMENALQHLPTPNVLYGVNGISVVGGLQALQAAHKAMTSKQLLAFATDGAEQEISFAANHISNTPLQLAAAISPVKLADLNFDTLTKVVSGSLSATKNSNTYIHESLLNYTSCAALKNWLAQDLLTKDKLGCT